MDTKIIADKKYKFKSNQFKQAIAEVRDHILQRNDPRCTTGQGAINIKAQVIADLKKLDFVSNIAIGTKGNNARLFIAKNKISAYLRTTKQGVSIDISAKADQAKIFSLLAGCCTAPSKVKKGASKAPDIKLVDIKTSANILGATPKFVKVHHRNDQPSTSKSWHIEINGITTLSNAVSVLGNINTLVNSLG